MGEGDVAMKVFCDWIHVYGTNLMKVDRWRNDFSYYGGAEHAYLFVHKANLNFVNVGCDGICVFFESKDRNKERDIIDVYIAGLGIGIPGMIYERTERETDTLDGVYEYFNWNRNDYEEFQLW